MRSSDGFLRWPSVMRTSPMGRWGHFRPSDRRVGHGLDPYTGEVLCGADLFHYALDLGGRLMDGDCKTCCRVARKRWGEPTRETFIYSKDEVAWLKARERAARKEAKAR